MKEIIEIIVIVALFIFFFCFLCKIYLKSNKKEEKKKEYKSAETKDKKEDIPEILKEVTMGNYMYDISKKIKVDEVYSGQSSKNENKFDIENAFDVIENQNLDDVELEEIEDDLMMDDIDFEIDSILEDDENVKKHNKNSKSNSLAEEYSNLSGNMKALIIANFLDKKHHDN